DADRTCAGVAAVPHEIVRRGARRRGRIEALPRREEEVLGRRLDRTGIRQRRRDRERRADGERGDDQQQRTGQGRPPVDWENPARGTRSRWFVTTLSGDTIDPWVNRTPRRSSTSA